MKHTTTRCIDTTNCFAVYHSQGMPGGGCEALRTCSRCYSSESAVLFM
jgi:hypothetical protein